MVGHLHRCFSCRPFQKVTIDEDNLWQDMIVQYKAKLDLSKQVCVCISNQPAIDTGGVRRHVYSILFIGVGSGGGAVGALAPTKMCEGGHHPHPG